MGELSPSWTFLLSAYQLWPIRSGLLYNMSNTWAAAVFNYFTQSLQAIEWRCMVILESTDDFSTAYWRVIASIQRECISVESLLEDRSALTRSLLYLAQDLLRLEQIPATLLALGHIPGRPPALWSLLIVD
jgi:hypothetical protein